MALLDISPSIVGSLAKGAAHKAANIAAQRMPPKLVRDVQRVLQAGTFLGNALGIQTGIGALDNILSLTGDVRDVATPLLGGLSLRQAEAMHDRLQQLRVARKNLFFIRLSDANPPDTPHAPVKAQQADPFGGIMRSGIGKAVSGAAARLLPGLAGMAIDAGESIGDVAIGAFDMLALDVSYGPSLNGDHVQIGSSFMDRPSGRNPTELQVTTMDDEAGTLKAWFDAKQEQVAHSDGTFGLPADYLVTLEIVHAVPSEEVAEQVRAYTKVTRMRPLTAQVDLSRREMAVAEMTLTFSQFDNFMGTGQ